MGDPTLSVAVAPAGLDWDGRRENEAAESSGVARHYRDLMSLEAIASREYPGLAPINIILLLSPGRAGVFLRIADTEVPARHGGTSK